MAEITRKIQKIFGGGLAASGNISKYGSKKAGTVSYSLDLDEIQTSAWLNGLLGSVATDKAPYLQDLNAIFYVLSKQLAYIFQAGVPEWNSQTEYFAGKSIVIYNGIVYIAITNSTNKAPTDTSYWMRNDNKEFNQTYATLIGGYKSGTILNFNGYKIKSLIDNNTNIPTVSNIRVSESETGTFYWELAEAIAPGTVIPYAGSKAPKGWLFCDGTAKARTTYPFLFKVIGTDYGDGDGSTTFNIPNYKFIDSKKTITPKIYGDGTTLGLRDGTGNARAGYYAESGDYHIVMSNTTDIKRSGASNVRALANDGAVGSFGVSTDEDNSGLTGKVTLENGASSLTSYIIKY